ncbi:MAG TPA: glycoside hydrolase family 9 protein, partial [Bacteroidales bacterium]|nr:glycoside hydrolase family 9 protein [Bacteroidales bacterium]
MKKLMLITFATLLLFNAKAADLIRVAPVTNKIIMLQFDDGYIKKHSYHESSSADVSFLWPIDTELADNIRTYSILSSDDDNYAAPLNPVDMGRKSKGHDFSEVCKNWNEEPWPKAACKNDYASFHFIYLELPQPMVSGKSYTIRFGDIADNMSEYTLVFDEKTSRSDAVHVNEMGYVPDAQKKFAYISQWMGTMGPFIDDALIGHRFDIYKLDASGQAGNSVFNGTVQLQHEYDQADNNRGNETPYSNYVVSNVYECDFSGFSDPGEYVIAVEGVGCSFPFRIDADAYQEAFYNVMKGLYLERGLMAEPEQYAGRWAHPAMDQASFVYTSVRTMDLTDESGNNQKKNIFDSFDWSVDLSGLRGWYHDAGDWDGYFSHFRIPRTLMMAYEMAPDNFSDGELNIPESQVEFNGYSGTNIPDILDEAVWLVDYFKNNVGPTGGIFGSRIDPDISSTDDSKGITETNYPDFVFTDKCRIDGIPSWEDCCTWIVHGEDPRDSYAFASIAAQYAYDLKIAATKTGQDYSAIITDYLDAAVSAYTWAANNTQTGDASKSDFVENRAAAAAWLYKNTGEQAYIDQLKADLATKNITANTSNLGSSEWAVWAYVTIDKDQALYSGTFDQALYDDLVSATLKDAEGSVTNAIDNGRSMRMGGNWSQPVWNGQGTTPWVESAMIASVVATNNSNPEAQKFLDACYTTSDYFLGGNQMNMVWLTELGHVRPEQIMHLDSEFNPNEPGYIPGIPPYGPRPRCDWFAPGPPHPYAGDNCYYNNSHDADFALLDGRIFPAYNDDKANLVWPVHELYFDNYGCPPTNEFTTHQTVAPAAAAYGFLTAPNGTAGPNQEPVVSVTTSAASYTQGEDVTINVTSSDPDGWVYNVDLYQNHRFIASIDGSQASFDWKANESGSFDITAVASDNMGARK